jgi:hypothetical protein
MAPKSSQAANWAVQQVVALVEIWALIAEYSGFVGAWRLVGVCKASREGAMEWLRSLPGLLVCGAFSTGGVDWNEVVRLDLGKLRWEEMPNLEDGRSEHACCAVRGRVVMLGGVVSAVVPFPGPAPLDPFGQQRQQVIRKETASVEVLGYDSETKRNIFKALPPLSCGPIMGAVALVVNETESDQGQVLLVGGRDGTDAPMGVHKVDLATGVCTIQRSLLSPQDEYFSACTAVRLADGRIVRVGTNVREGVVSEAPYTVTYPPIRAQVLENHGSLSEASWRWRDIPDLGVLGYIRGGGCVLSDGRFAVFGISDGSDQITTACKVLTLDGGDERWDPLPILHEDDEYTRDHFVCAAIGGCVFVLGGTVYSTTVEVYEEALGRWRRLPCDHPLDDEKNFICMALM